MDNNNSIYFKENQYGYHITTKDNIDSISKVGLIPSIGKRSLSINEKNKAIFFCRFLIELDNWINDLYPNYNLNELELLRFSLGGKEAFYKDFFIGDYYLLDTISPNELEILNRISSNGETFNIKGLVYKQYKEGLRWEPIIKNNKLERKKQK